MIYFDDFGNEYQIFFGIHIDKQNPHIHFALNPISYEDGKGFYVNDKIIDNMMATIAEITNQEVGYMLKYGK